MDWLKHCSIWLSERGTIRHTYRRWDGSLAVPEESSLPPKSHCCARGVITTPETSLRPRRQGDILLKATLGPRQHRLTNRNRQAGLFTHFEWKSYCSLSCATFYIRSRPLMISDKRRGWVWLTLRPALQRRRRRFRQYQLDHGALGMNGVK